MDCDLTAMTLSSHLPASEAAVLARARLPQAPLLMPKQSLDPVWTPFFTRASRLLGLFARRIRRNLKPQG